MATMHVTFGQIHVHHINDQTFDKNCVAVIIAHSIKECNRIAFEVFEGKFHEHVDAKQWDESKMKYFPRGYIVMRYPVDNTELLLVQLRDGGAIQNRAADLIVKQQTEIEGLHEEAAGASA
jgi:hypothetical protein